MSAPNQQAANWTVQNQRPVAQETVTLIRGVITDGAAETVSARYPIPRPQEQIPTSETSSVVNGHCFCEKVRLELPLRLQPSISVICHCQDCREWHSVGSIPYMMFPLDYTEDASPQVPIKVSI